MRSSYVRLPLLAATVWMGIGFSVRATDIRYGETVFVTPTSTTFSLAPSYVVSRSYVTPTAYVVPSYYSTGYVVPSYYSTAYVAPSYYSTAYVVPSYVSTAYVSEPLTLLPTTYVATTDRRGLLGRRWLVERPVIASYGTTYFPSSYETAYAPSSYVRPTYYATSYRLRTYTPTVYEYPAVWETASVIPRGDCDEVAWTYPVQTPPASSITGSRAGTSNKAAQSESNEEPIPSYVDVPPRDEPAAPRKPTSDAAKAQTPAAGRADSPPVVPAADQGQTTPKNQTNQPAPKAVPGAGANPGASKPDADAAAKAKAGAPAAPSGDPNELLPAPGADSSGTIRRDAGKAVYSSTRALRPERRNVLIGRVESSAGDPQGEVPVTVTSRSNNLIHHDGLTNAFGGFAIRLSDGEWTVNVRMPSGRLYPVRSVTVSNGRVLDNQEGREVYSLIISY
ncbi:MAG: hypothetical protein ACHRXM_35660 [Isosphaerales bacterium]